MTGEALIPAAAATADIARHVRLRIEAATAILAAVVIAVAVLAVVALAPFPLGMALVAFVDRAFGIDVIISGNVSHGAPYFADGPAR